MGSTRKLTIAGVSIAVAIGSVALVGTGVAFANKAPSPGSVTCSTLSGVLKLSPPLTTNGPTIGTETTTFKGKVSNCTASGTGAVTPKSAKVSSLTTSNTGSSCAGFSSSIIKNSTTFTVKWAPSSISPTVITFPAGDISVASNDEGFTLGGGKGPVTGSGSYPGTDTFAGSTAKAATNVNLLSGLCAKGKPQKTIAVTSGTIVIK